MALAGYAHGFSTGAERIFERLAVDLGEERPRGEYWHGDLRNQMADAQTRRRPAVIDEPWRAPIPGVLALPILEEARRRKSREVSHACG